MKSANAVRSSITFLVLMVVILFGVMVVAGAGVGPLELAVWLGLVVLGLTVIVAGRRSAHPKK